MSSPSDRDGPGLVNSAARGASRSRPATEEGRSPRWLRRGGPADAARGIRRGAVAGRLCNAWRPRRHRRAGPSSPFDRARPPPTSIPCRAPSGRSSSLVPRKDRAGMAPEVRLTSAVGVRPALAAGRADPGAEPACERNGSRPAGVYGGSGSGRGPSGPAGPG